jgi:hypothetical protein
VVGALVGLLGGLDGGGARGGPAAASHLCSSGVNTSTGGSVYRGWNGGVMMGEERMVMVKDVARPDALGLGRRVGSTVVGGRWWVSTVVVGFGIPHETMVFASDADGNVSEWGEVYCDRYETLEEAVAGHKEVVRLFVERCEREEGVNA